MATTTKAATVSRMGRFSKLKKVSICFTDSSVCGHFGLDELCPLGFSKCLFRRCIPWPVMSEI